MAVAISGSIPGTVIILQTTSFFLAQRAISASSFPITAFRWESAVIRLFSVDKASVGNPLSGSKDGAQSKAWRFKRMARPGCKRQLLGDVTSLHKRIRHVGTAAAARMEILAFRSS